MNARILAILVSLSFLNIQVHAESPVIHVPQATVAESKIDLNKADLSKLTGSFKGIGKKRAEAIIAYRESHQGFKSIEELADVKGFSQRYMEANRDNLLKIFVINE